MILNPFTYNFFNPVLDHFLCSRLSEGAHIIQFIYSFIQLVFGVIIFFAVIKLENRSFLNIFEVDTLQSDKKKNRKTYSGVFKKKNEGLLNSQSDKHSNPKYDINNIVVDAVTKTYETNDYSNAKQTLLKSEQKVRGVSFTVG
jgi:hypothetical protein